MTAASKGSGRPRWRCGTRRRSTTRSAPGIAAAIRSHASGGATGSAAPATTRTGAVISPSGAVTSNPPSASQQAAYPSGSIAVSIAMCRSTSSGCAARNSSVNQRPRVASAIAAMPEERTVAARSCHGRRPAERRHRAAQHRGGQPLRPRDRQRLARRRRRATARRTRTGRRPASPASAEHVVGQLRRRRTVRAAPASGRARGCRSAPPGTTPTARRPARPTSPTWCPATGPARPPGRQRDRRRGAPARRSSQRLVPRQHPVDPDTDVRGLRRRPGVVPAERGRRAGRGCAAIASWSKRHSATGHAVRSAAAPASRSIVAQRLPLGVPGAGGRSCSEAPAPDEATEPSSGAAAAPRTATSTDRVGLALCAIADDAPAGALVGLADLGLAHQQQVGGDPCRRRRRSRRARWRASAPASGGCATASPAPTGRASGRARRRRPGRPRRTPQPCRRARRATPAAAGTPRTSSQRVVHAGEPARGPQAERGRQRLLGQRAGHARHVARCSSASAASRSASGRPGRASTCRAARRSRPASARCRGRPGWSRRGAPSGASSSDEPPAASRPRAGRPGCRPADGVERESTGRRSARRSTAAAVRHRARARRSAAVQHGLEARTIARRPRPASEVSASARGARPRTGEQTPTSATPSVDDDIEEDGLVGTLESHVETVAVVLRRGDERRGARRRRARSAAGRRRSLGDAVEVHPGHHPAQHAAREHRHREVRRLRRPVRRGYAGRPHGRERVAAVGVRGARGRSRGSRPRAGASKIPGSAAKRPDSSACQTSTSASGSGVALAVVAPGRAA